MTVETAEVMEWFGNERIKNRGTQSLWLSLYTVLEFSRVHCSNLVHSRASLRAAVSNWIS
jgi:hypothetical protein